MNALALIRRRAVLARVHGGAWIGRLGAAGLLLLALGAVAAWWSQRLDEDSSALREQYDAEGARLRQGLTLRSLDPAAQMQEFYEGFPRADSNLADLRAIFRIARDQRIALPHGDYVAVRRTDARMTTCDVMLPVRASYPTLRAFVASVLNELPHASLAELRLERAGGDQLDARIHLTLHYREN
jgi:hypothetical protein